MLAMPLNHWDLLRLWFLGTCTAVADSAANRYYYSMFLPRGRGATLGDRICSTLPQWAKINLRPLPAKQTIYYIVLLTIINYYYLLFIIINYIVLFLAFWSLKSHLQTMLEAEKDPRSSKTTSAIKANWT